MSQLSVVSVWACLLWSQVLLTGVEGLPARATFYGGSDASGTNTGACGYNNVLSMGFGTMTTALSAPLFQAGDACGACYRIRCSGSQDAGCLEGAGQIVVTATNLCPHGSEGGWCDGVPHFDLSQPAFSRIANPIAGVVDVDYERVPCERQGGMHFQLMGQRYFLQVLIYNVAGEGDIASVQVRGGDGEWISMTRSWGQLWQTGQVLDGQPLSFSVTTGDGKTCLSEYVVPSQWEYGQTYEGEQY